MTLFPDSSLYQRAIFQLIRQGHASAATLYSLMSSRQHFAEPTANINWKQIYMDVVDIDILNRGNKIEVQVCI